MRFQFLSTALGRFPKNLAKLPMTKAVVALAAASASIHASSIISVVGSGKSGPAVQAAQYLEQSWTESQTYTNVAISVELYSWTPNVPFNINGFLTTSIGPSAPPPLATTSFTGVTTDAAGLNVVLFSGLTLGPGAYYLTLSGTDVGAGAGAIWQEGGTPVLDYGVSLGATLLCSSGVCSQDFIYPPASPFIPGLPLVPGPLTLIVTGTRMVKKSVLVENMGDLESPHVRVNLTLRIRVLVS